MAQLNFGGVTETVVIRDEFPLEKAREVLKDETIAVIGWRNRLLSKPLTWSNFMVFRWMGNVRVNLVAMPV